MVGKGEETFTKGNDEPGMDTNERQCIKIADAYGRCLSLKRVHQYLCLFVFIRGSSSLRARQVLVRMIRTARQSPAMPHGVARGSG